MPINLHTRFSWFSLPYLYQGAVETRKDDIHILLPHELIPALPNSRSQARTFSKFICSMIRSDIFDQVILGYGDVLDKVTSKIQLDSSILSNDVAWYQQITIQIQWNFYIEKNPLKLTQQKKILTEINTRSASLMASSILVEKNRFFPRQDSTTSFSPG